MSLRELLQVVRSNPTGRYEVKVTRPTAEETRDGYPFHINIVPSLSLDASFTACRSVMAKDTRGEKHKLLEGIKADRDLLERLQRGIKAHRRLSGSCSYNGYELPRSTSWTDRPSTYRKDISCDS